MTRLGTNPRIIDLIAMLMRSWRMVCSDTTIRVCGACKVYITNWMAQIVELAPLVDTSIGLIPSESGVGTRCSGIWTGN